MGQGKIAFIHTVGYVSEVVGRAENLSAEVLLLEDGLTLDAVLSNLFDERRVA